MKLLAFLRGMFRRRRSVSGSPAIRSESLGDRGERLAAEYLQERGYRIRDKGYRCRFGEVDIIASLKKRIVFVEVKTRSGERHGSPHEAVDLRKQKRIARTALEWLKARRLLDRPCRFDIIAIVIHGNLPADIRHYEAAFESPLRDGMCS